MAGLIPFNRGTSLFHSAGDFYNMLDDFFNDSWLPRRSLMGDTFKVDVRENDKEYVIDADLPGVKKEEIGLSFEDGRLTLSVNRSEEKSEDTDSYVHRERHFSSMQRSVYLGDADESNISAKLDNGVLCVTVQKHVKTPSSRKIEIE